VIHVGGMEEVTTAMLRKLNGKHDGNARRQQCPEHIGALSAIWVPRQISMI
jgi:hypothetical protein